MIYRKYFCGVLLCAVSKVAAAQQGPDMQKILDRLDQLEQENHKLLDEIHQLRREVSVNHGTEASTPTVEERVDIAERRIDEQAQTKVESSQKFPLAITGMLLFNAFENTPYGGGNQNPVVAEMNRQPVNAGGSLQQTILGLKFDGPNLPGGGKASGTLYMDFFGGYGLSNLHVRTGTLDLAWKNTTLTFGQDKPILAPRDPDSLAQVGLPPLTGAGNLWAWQPQVKLEQRFTLGDNSGFRAQAGVYETSEPNGTIPVTYQNTAENSRPGYEGRFEFWHGQEGNRFAIAPGFHFSDTHIAGVTVPSRIFSLDGLWKPLSFLQFTGAWFHGQNVATTGALPDSFTILRSGRVIPVHSTGGWAQVALFPSPRLSFHVYGGEQRNRLSDLQSWSIGHNLIYAGNVMYRLAPNILASFEASQVRTFYVGTGTRLNNHYDLALAYLF